LMFRCVGGRPGPRRERRAQRRRSRSRCQPSNVPGVTISRIRDSREAGSSPASNTSHARSAHVSSAQAADPDAAQPPADAATSGSRRPWPSNHSRADASRRPTGSRPGTPASTPRTDIIPARAGCRHPQLVLPARPRSPRRPGRRSLAMTRAVQLPVDEAEVLEGIGECLLHTGEDETASRTCAVVRQMGSEHRSAIPLEGV
jgi:hypothetical protein